VTREERTLLLCMPEGDSHAEAERTKWTFKVRDRMLDRATVGWWDALASRAEALTELPRVVSSNQAPATKQSFLSASSANPATIRIDNPAYRNIVNAPNV